jgi:hypothetical protein
LNNLSAGDSTQIKNPAPSKIAAELTKLANAPEIGPAVTLLKQVSEEGFDRTKALAIQVYSVVHPLVVKIVNLEEKIEMLSWHIGGWSRLLDKPFGDFEIGTASVLAGIDVADMSRSTTGPIPARALLQRTIYTGRKGRPPKISLSDAVNGLDGDSIGRLDLGQALRPYADICPVLTALARAREVGTGAAWHESFARDSHIDAGVTLSPMDLAMQTYRERLVIRQLS